jgi:hypothetical protein
MRKSRFAVIAACAVLAFVTAAAAKVHHHNEHAAASRPVATHNGRSAVEQPDFGSSRSRPTMVPPHPLVVDCVRVAFPQCSPAPR